MFGAVVTKNNFPMTAKKHMVCQTRISVSIEPKPNNKNSQPKGGVNREFPKQLNCGSLAFVKRNFHVISKKKMFTARSDTYNLERTCRCCSRNLARLVPLNQPVENIDGPNSSGMVQRTIGDVLIEFGNISVCSFISI